jgi:hypothetical protein
VTVTGLALGLARRRARQNGPKPASNGGWGRFIDSATTVVAIGLIISGIIGSVSLQGLLSPEAPLGSNGISNINTTYPPMATVKVSVPEGSTVRQDLKSGTKYVMDGDDVSFALGGQSFLIIAPDDKHSFNVSSITVVGHKAAYDLSLDTSTCKQGTNMVSDDVGIEVTKSCTAIITSRAIEADDHPTPPGVPTEGDVNQDSQVIKGTGREFVYVEFNKPNQWIGIVDNYGAYSAFADSCVLGNTLGDVKIGPHSMVIECLNVGRKLKVTYDSQGLPSTYRYENYVPYIGNFNWGSGPVPDPHVGPVMNTPDRLSSGLDECRKTGSDSCYLNMAVLLKDVSLCEQVKNLYPTLRYGVLRYGSDNPDRQSCYYQVALATNNPQTCQKIELELPTGSEIIKPRYNCIFRIAQQTSNPKICDYMNEADKSYCLEYSGGSVPPWPQWGSNAMRTLSFKMTPSAIYPQAYLITADTDNRSLPKDARLVALSFLDYDGDCAKYRGQHDMAEVFLDVPLNGTGGGLPWTSLFDKEYLKSGAVRCVQLWSDDTLTKPLSPPIRIVLP